MSGTQTREIQTLKPVISDRTVRLDGVEGYLQDRNGVKASSERILGLVSTPDGYEENRGKWIFYNLEGKMLLLTRYMEANDNGKLVEIEGKNEKEIEAKWVELPENKRVDVSDRAIEKAARYGVLAIGVDYDHRRLDLDGVDKPDIDAWVAYDKQPQAGVLELRKGDMLEIKRGGQITLMEFDGDAVVTVKRR